MKKIGGQAGSNPGALYEAADGSKYYVKTAKSEAHAQTEVLAAKLYAELGVDVPDVSLARRDGKTAVASRIVEKSHVGPVELATLPGVAEGFVADAFLGNWDVVGLGAGNLAEGANGRAIRLDTGGALLFRAQGGEKGKAFGKDVLELDSLRNPHVNPIAAKVFAGVTKSQINAGIDNIAAKLTDAKIAKLVRDHGPSGFNLTERLIARKNSLIVRKSKIRGAARFAEAFSGGVVAFPHFAELVLGLAFNKKAYMKEYNARRRSGGSSTVTTSVSETGWATFKSDAGAVEGKISGGVLTIREAHVTEAERGKGHGTLLYESALAHAQNKGLGFQSSEAVSISADRTWAALAKRGHNVVRAENVELDTT